VAVAMDVVTVFHNERNYAQHLDLCRAIEQWEGHRVNVVVVDNRVDNRGFARACNLGAKEGTAPCLGFLNPDAVVSGPFVDQVIEALRNPEVVITGCRFDKPAHELRIWGCREWVCGAAMFVRRAWFEATGGFHEGYTWSWEDSDLVRRAEQQGLQVRPIVLPITHQSPSWESPEDAAYKRRHFDEGARLFRARWPS
jgi:N-acetylglucosaminyl-diphospho-decaprenol L-rhamnosyltransferase